MQETTDLTVLNTSWVESLAMDEINMEETGVVNFNHHLDSGHLIEESSIEIMEEIRERFEIYISKFNEYRGQKGDSSLIKIFKISNTVNDFMLYRNSLKLVVARRSRDAIAIGFISTSGFFPNGQQGPQKPSMQMSHEIRANIGPFNDITWCFQGEKIKVDQLVKHYLTEFIRISAR